MSVSSQLLALVLAYGYAAAFVGILVEGETVLLLSGIAAHRGYLDAPLLLVVGSSAAILTDNFFFALGRTFGSPMLARLPRLSRSVERVQALLVRFPRTAVLVMRFLYGTRTVGPALLGAGTLGWARFAALDAIAACLWCACWLTIGYVIGEAIEQSLQDVVGVGRWMLLGAVTMVAALAALLYRYRRRARPSLPSEPGQLM